MEKATPTTLAPANGSLLAVTVAGSNNTAEIELHELDLRLEPGDVLAVSLQTASGSAVTVVGINWNEI